MLKLLLRLVSSIDRFVFDFVFWVDEFRLFLAMAAALVVISAAGGLMKYYSKATSCFVVTFFFFSKICDIIVAVKRLVTTMMQHCGSLPIGNSLFSQFNSIQSIIIIVRRVRV